MSTVLRIAARLLPWRPFQTGPRLCRIVISRGLQPLASFTVEVADGLFSRAKGLMGRPALEGSDGMLFVYPWPRTARIWMARTLIPLDAVFVDRAGAVVKIAANLQPHAKTPVSSDGPVKWVLEIAAGSAASHGLAIGDRLEIEC